MLLALWSKFISPAAPSSLLIALCISFIDLSWSFCIFSISFLISLIAFFYSSTYFLFSCFSSFIAVSFFCCISITSLSLFIFAYFRLFISFCVYCSYLSYYSPCDSSFFWSRRTSYSAYECPSSFERDFFFTIFNGLILGDLDWFSDHPLKLDFIMWLRTYTNVSVPARLSIWSFAFLKAWFD